MNTRFHDQISSQWPFQKHWFHHSKMKSMLAKIQIFVMEKTIELKCHLIHTAISYLIKKAISCRKWPAKDRWTRRPVAYLFTGETFPLPRHQEHPLSCDWLFTHLVLRIGICPWFCHRMWSPAGPPRCRVSHPAACCTTLCHLELKKSVSFLLGFGHVRFLSLQNKILVSKGWHFHDSRLEIYCWLTIKNQECLLWQTFVFVRQFPKGRAYLGDNALSFSRTNNGLLGIHRMNPSLVSHASPSQLQP